MRKLLLLLCSLFVCLALSAGDDRHVCEMMPYPDDCATQELTPAPDGYELVYISHYGRHGSRTVTSRHVDLIQCMWSSLSTAHYKKALTEDGETLFAEVDKVWRASKGHFGFLTQKGVHQHQRIASRMLANYPGMFAPGARVNVMCSVYPRCLVSMSAFTNTLTSNAQGLDMHYECSPNIQGCISTSISQELRDGIKELIRQEAVPKAYKDDNLLLKYFKGAKNARKYVADSDSFFDALYQLAANSPNVDVDAKLIDIVPREVMDYYGVAHNRMVYYLNSGSTVFGRQRMAETDSLVLSMLKKTDAALAGNGVDVDLLFGHDYALLAYLSHLGAICNDLGGSEIDEKFVSSDIIPMAANLQQLFYRNADGQVLVKFVLNEKEMSLIGLTPVSGAYYKWSDVRKRLCSVVTPRREVYVEGGPFHVQGLAYDSREDCMYMSFTSVFYKTDMEGNVVASISGINGHLGAMVFDPVERKVYASLELKDDSIGRNISSKLGDKLYSRDESVFYVAQIDVDKMTALDMPEEGIIKRIRVQEACLDYKAHVNIDGREKEHRYACSGIDAVTIAPEIGRVKSSRDYLYVAYGIYGDVDRTDNDYNVILAYPLQMVRDAAKLSDPVLKKYNAKYFVHTGNTNWGVQNMSYDPLSQKLYLAVYKGKKAQWPNYSHFAIDMNQKPFKAALEGVSYDKTPKSQLKVAHAWNYKWGATGMCSLGDGRLYISQNGKNSGCNFCRATLTDFSSIEK